MDFTYVKISPYLSIQTIPMSKKSSNKHHRHDTVFKLAMSEIRVAKEMIENNLPKDIVKCINLDSLSISNNSYIDHDLKKSHADILYKAKTKSGSETYIYFLWEHQSTYDKNIPLRMLKYTVNILQEHLNAGHQKLPLVIPALVYNGVKTPYPGSCDICDSFDDPGMARLHMFKPFSLFDLSSKNDEELQQAKWSALPNIILKHIRDRDITKVLEKTLELSIGYCLEHDGKLFIQNMLKCVIEYTNIPDSDAFRDQIQKASPEAGAEIMTIYEQLINKGIDQGINQGVNKGMLEARHHIIVNLIKDGRDNQYIAKIADTSIEEVKAIRAKLT